MNKHINQLWNSRKAGGKADDLDGEVATSEASQWYGHSPVSATKTWGSFAIYYPHPLYQLDY